MNARRYLVGAGEQCRRHVEAEQLGARKIDDEIEFWSAARLEVRQKSRRMIQWRWRMKAERDNRSPHRAVERLIAVTLAWLSLASITVAQTPVPARPDSRERMSDSSHL